jgi:hypothetical protein
LKEAMGLSSVKELPSVMPTFAAREETVRFKGVYWHKGIQAYTTRVATGKTYKSPRAAAKAIGQVKKGLKASIILSRVRAIQQIYRGLLPADCADMHRRSKVMRKLTLQEPSLEPLILQLKYGPWRSAVVKAWLQQPSVQSPVFKKRTVEERARSLHAVLKTAVLEISKSGVSRLWGRNCGRFVGRHSGGAPVLRHLGVIVAVGAGKPGMQFHDRESQGEVSDDSDDEAQGAYATAWKFGPVKRSHG